MSTLAERVIELREAAKISQGELSKLAGLQSRRHVGLIENGDRPNLEHKTLRGLATALGSSVGWLSDGEGERPTDEQVQVAVEAARVAAKLKDQSDAELEDDNEEPEDGSSPRATVEGSKAS